MENTRKDIRDRNKRHKVRSVKIEWIEDQVIGNRRIQIREQFEYETLELKT